jgi:uncharacterized protein YndB with AHSA1/START domain
MEASNVIVREITIDADNATVFAFFTDSERLIRWMGVSAQVEPKPCGLLLIDVQEGYIARGEFREVVPVSRLVFTFGWEGSKENVPPGSSLVEIDLLPKNGSTLLSFRHSGLPAEAVPGHNDGWNHYLGRLALAASGIDPGFDPRRAR